MSKDVWITTNHRSGNDVYHTTRDCPRLPDDESRVGEVSLAEVHGREPCRDPACEGGEPEKRHDPAPCPRCGTPTKNLGAHLRHKCPTEVVSHD